MPSYESQATLPQYFLLKARALPIIARSTCLAFSCVRVPMTEIPELCSRRSASAI